MLELSLHQGTSLYSRAQQDTLRLIAVASAPGGRTLELLWAVCTQLQGLGYPTVVLDGTASETSESPGLIDLLEHNFWLESPANGLAPTEQSLAVLPATRGLAMLSPSQHVSAAPLACVQPLLRRYAVVVLYAAMPVLASSLLVGSEASPVVLLESDEDAIMKSYKDLKWLARETGLSGTVVSLAHGQAASADAHRQQRVLRDCAATHLGQPPRTLVLDPERAADLQRLALHVLESAETLCALETYGAVPSSYGASRAAQFAKSH